jgi:SAM-dependent methyltransferase
LDKKINSSMDPVFWINAWENARTKNPGAKKLIRSDTEMIEYWNHLAASYDKIHSSSAPSKRVRVVLDILQREEFLKPHYDILDIGCGPGNYTLPFSEMCKSVIALDSAAEMCRQLEMKAEKLGRKNITVLNYPWEGLELKNEGLEINFDLSFASMTTAINNYETLMQMNRSSRRNCCLIFWAENGINLVREDLYRLIFKENDPGSSMASIIYPFNLLFSLGYFPKIEFIDSGWSTTEPVDKAIDSICNYFWLYTEITPSIKNIITRYVLRRAIKGEFTRETKARLGIVTWKGLSDHQHDTASETAETL